MPRSIAFAAALAALAIAAAPALAHEGNPNYESLVTGVTPQLAGVTVDVLNGDDRLEIVNRGTRTVVLEGYNREPYVRLAPGGEVAVNLRSPAYYLNRVRLDTAAVEVPDAADPQAAPVWKVVERTGRFEFHDHRMHWMAKGDPPQVRDKGSRTKVFDWRIPVRADGGNGAISGTLYWRGSSAGAPVGAFVGFGALLLVGVAAVFAVRGRRRRGDAPTPGRGEAW